MKYRAQLMATAGRLRAADDANGPAVAVIVESPEAAGGQGDGGEMGEGSEAPAEALADAAVEIAQINADRDVDLALIHTEAEAQRVEAFASEELSRCRERIAELEGLNLGLNSELETLRALIPPPSPEPPPSPPEADPSPEGEGPAQEPEESASPGPVEEPPPRRRRGIRWI